MTDDKVAQDGIEAEKLAKVLGAMVAQNTPGKVAGLAYLQATMAQCALQAIIDMLRHKGIVSESEISAALAAAYRNRRAHAEHSSIIVPAAPQVRPQNGKDFG